MGWVFWAGIIIGFLIVRHFFAPFLAKSIAGDLNRIQSNPQLASQLKTG